MDNGPGQLRVERVIFFVCLSALRNDAVSWACRRRDILVLSELQGGRVSCPGTGAGSVSTVRLREEG